jgi:hypothetical protein
MTTRAAAPEITGTRADVTVSWSLEVCVEPGSIPDRVMPYSKAGLSYRPVRLRLTFGVTAASLTLAQLNLRHDRMADMARREITLTGVALSGPRLLVSGQPGVHIHTEKFYGSLGNVPDWAMSLASAALADLTWPI